MAPTNREESYGSLPTEESPLNVEDFKSLDATATPRRLWSPRLLIAGALASMALVILYVATPLPSMRMSSPTLSFKKSSDTTESTVDTATWSYGGSWAENGLGAGSWSNLGASSTLSNIYVTDQDGNLKVSTDAGSSFKTTQPFTYSYGGTSKSYTITQISAASSTPTTAYATTQWSYSWGAGNVGGKVFKTTDGGATWASAGTPSTSSYATYGGVATSSTGQYVLTWDTASTYYGYVSSDYGQTFTARISYGYYYPVRGAAVSSSGQYMYFLADNYLFTSTNFGSSGFSYTSKAFTYGYSTTISQVTCSADGAKVLVTGYYGQFYSSNYGSSFSTLSPTLNTYAHLFYYSMIYAAISPDGSTIGFIQKGAPKSYYGSGESYIRYASTSNTNYWSSLYPSSLGQFTNDWYVTQFAFNYDGSKITAMAPTTGYYDGYYRYQTKTGSGWTGTSSSSPTVLPTLNPTSVPTKAPTSVPTNTPAPTALPSFTPTMKPNSATPAPTGGQITGSLVGRNVNSLQFTYISVGSSGIYTAYRSNAYGDAGIVYGSLDGGNSWSKEQIYQSTTSYVGCSAQTIAQAGSGITGLKTTYSSTTNKVHMWFTCGPYTSYGTTKIQVSFCTGSMWFHNQWTCTSTTVYSSTYNSAFLTVGQTALSSDGLKFALAGQEGGLLIFQGLTSSNKASSINQPFTDFGSSSSSFGYNKYGGIAWSYDGSALLVAPNTGLNLWYVTIPSNCYTGSCKISSMSAITTSPNLPASASGSTGTWTSCAALTDNNYMACTQYGGYTYFSTDQGVSWLKLGTKSTYIKQIAMYYGSGSGQACLAGISTYGSPYLMTNANGKSATEWVSQNIGNYYYGYGYNDVAVSSCSNIYATAASAANDNNILSTSGTFSEVNSALTYTFNEAEDDSLDTTDYAWTWGSLSSTTETSYASIAASSDSVYIYTAYTDSKIRTSSDGGSSWNTVSDLSKANWGAISCSSSGQYVSAVNSDGQIYTSSDYGTSWTSATLVDTDSFISAAISNDGSTVLVGGNNGLYLSSNTGNSFARVDTDGFISSNSTYGFSVVMSDNGKHLFAASGFGGMIVSSDYGASWDYYASDRVFASIAYANSVLYAVSVQDGVYTSSDKGETWSIIDNAPKQQDWKAIAVSSDGMFIAAASTYDRISVSDDGGDTWGTIGDGDMWTSLAFVSDGKVLLAASQGKTSLNQAIYSDSTAKSLRGSSGKKSGNKKTGSKKEGAKKSNKKSGNKL